MITFFSIPKPWDGRIGTIQENAVRSWRAVDGASIVLCGSEPGVAEAAARLGVLHLPDLLRSPIGTPRLDDALERVEQVAAPGLRCFVNADIVVPRDLGRTVEAVERLGRPSIVAGQTLNLEVEGLVDVGDPQQGEALSTRAAAEGIRRGPTAIDYVVFPAHHFDPMPPFLVGRAGFDNWMIREGRRRGLVVDATAAVTAVHQAHDYAHVAGGKAAAYYGDEASENLRLAGGSRNRYTLLDASHRLTKDLDLRRNPWAPLRIGETGRRVAWKLGYRGRNA